MPTLLHIDSSPRGDLSISRALTEDFVDAWKDAHPDSRVVAHDLAATPPPPIDGAWIQANFTPPDARSAEQRAVLQLSDAFIADLRAADRYVIGAPLYNFNIISTLKAWIDQIVRVGETFRYTAQGPVGLLEGKRATFVVSAGGTYGPGAEAQSIYYVEPYLRTMFGFLGVTDVSFVLADGAAALNRPGADREAFLAAHRDLARTWAAD